MGLLEGKKALIFGVANDKSIAWAVAEAFRREGAEIALAYAGESVAKRVIPLGESIGASMILPCDVRSDEDIARLFSDVAKQWGGLDLLVHSVAFANKDELKGSFLNTTREGFATALDISAYSLIALAKEAAPLMQGREGSIIAMTYYGAQKVFPNYNVMGVAKAALEASVRYLAEAMGPEGTRVNAISAGPLRTLASAGIGGFGQIAGHVAGKAPLRRNITQEDVANSALYLASPLAGGVSGEIHFVDSGYNIIGL
ncbi:enoyl-(acyl carrier protein) reductase [Citrifermentans bemidjiense Bem]|uniref:Enoyl-[acyl-carrier-protein] reductase [NADH] n=1 Tax=Citrifermentans bemidjiense (strain ATCC BAA-1014 / DSM 16622 / JCM 12645 / Bem) TaxID=404380 RepID=B5EIB6_CITBB|nr:enoyl-ACP reductase [Citrifermentans bemidjiense]ACH39818.1 enoyl-(acyl carrier protein) reductase [Citrifermentans bemidjiense Bem]